MGRSVSLRGSDGITTTLSTNIERKQGRHDETSEKLERQAQILQKHYEEKVIELDKLETQATKLAEKIMAKREYLDGLMDAAAYSKRIHEGYVAEQLYFDFTKAS